MTIGTRIFLAYLVLFTLCLATPLNWVIDTLETRYREGVEDPLADQANILAAVVEEEMRQQRFAADPANCPGVATDSGRLFLPLSTNARWPPKSTGFIRTRSMPISISPITAASCFSIPGIPGISARITASGVM